MATGLLCPRRTHTSGSRGGHAVVDGGSFGTRGRARRELQGREGRALFSLHPRADAVLRNLLGVGALVASVARARGALRLAHGGLASASPGAAGSVPADRRSRPTPAAGAGRGARLDGIGPQSRGPGRVLRALPRGRGGALLLRALPGRIRPGPPQATGRLVHAERGRALHGRPRRQSPEGRPWRGRWPSGGERLRARPVLRHRSLPRRSAATHRLEPRWPGPWRPRWRARAGGGDEARVRVRDHARTLRGRASASASSRITRGSTDCPSRGCASGSWRRSTWCASTA